MQQVPTSGGARDFTDEEMDEINAAHAAELDEEAVWAVHGEEADWMTAKASRCAGSSEVLSPPNGLPGADNDGLRDTPSVSKPLGFGLSGAGVDGFRKPHESMPLGLGLGLSEARPDGFRTADDSSTSEWLTASNLVKRN